MIIKIISSLFKRKSLAERVNKKLMSGYEPSEYAKKFHISSTKFNKMMRAAVVECNKEHKEKIFK